MEMVSLFLIALGIFIGIPTVIGFGVAAIYCLSSRRTQRSERMKSHEEAVSGTPMGQSTETTRVALAREETLVVQR